MQVIGDVPVFGDPVDPVALAQIQRCPATADAAVLMADHHLGYAVPIGGVVIYKDAISPLGEGYDIGCGNKAVLTDRSCSSAATPCSTTTSPPCAWPGTTLPPGLSISPVSC